MKQLLKMYILLLCAAVTMSACTDDNTVENQTQGDRGATVNFNVSSAQDEMLLQQQTAPVTRSAVLSRLGEEGLTLEDLVTHKYTVQGAPDLCLIETTVEGVNPVLPSADTRANVKTSIDGTFTSLGYRSDAAGFSPDKPDWFYNAPTNSNGTLVTPLQWAWTHRYGRFYAVFPEAKTENKITFSPASYSGTPYVEFEAEQDVKKQKDLMTACSGEVEYQTRGVAPQTNLEFYHALTAVRFAVGQNLSWNKRITKVEIKNAYSKGRYTLPTEFNGKGSWVDGSLTDRKDFTLDVSASPIDLRQAPNTVIMGNPADNYTFYMIPQDLTGVTVVVTLESTHPGSTAPNTITIPLTGKWKPGTSKLYKLSQNTSDWTYHLTVTSPAAVAYDATQTGNYGIMSYKQAPDGTQQPVRWKVVKYQESTDDGATWSAESDTKPAWLTSLTKSEGDGGTYTEFGTATIQKAPLIDKIAAYNKELQDAAPKGSAANPYNLANPGGNGARDHIEETANCYLISAPGHYCIPLVYGNSIKNDASNTRSYKSSLPASTNILKNFKDQRGIDISNPRIDQQQGGGLDDAKIVWMDHPNLVRASSLQIVNNVPNPILGSTSYLEFEVKKEDIRNGNAVIAVGRGGVIAWSWHLWFDHSDVLNTVPFTNPQGYVYKFTKQTLGFSYIKWEISSYDKPRKARLKVEQTAGNGIKQFAYVDITQNPGGERKVSPTFYQWGRKDAFPGTDALAPGSSFTANGGDHMSIQNGIQNPSVFYTDGSSWKTPPPTGYAYYNLWSADNATTGFNDNTVVKTIYDPCPAGFKMPASNAFFGFTTNGQNGGPKNVSGTWNYGWNFNNKVGNPDATLFFPALSFRNTLDGKLYIPPISSNYSAHYWAAIPFLTGHGCGLYFSSTLVIPHQSSEMSRGESVRPVADE